VHWPVQDAKQRFSELIRTAHADGPQIVTRAQEWGRLSVPDPLPVIDGLLTASARLRGWTLVTRNVADFRRTGVALLNPFDPRPSS
jgi:toxin FitB